jgi:hypothetical protein
MVPQNHWSFLLDNYVLQDMMHAAIEGIKKSSLPPCMLLCRQQSCLGWVNEQIVPA